MNGKERLLAVLNGKATDRMPSLSVCQYATFGLMERTGAYWPKAHYDGAQMARLSAGGRDILHLDGVRVPYCQTVEAEVYGSVIKDGGRKNFPSVEKPAYTIDDLPEIPENFIGKGRIPAVLDAIRLLKEQVGADTAVMGSMVGPFSVAANVLGVSVLLKSVLRKADKLVPFFEAAEQTAEQYADAIIEAGADVIVIEDMMASLDMISPRTFRQMALPYEKQLIEHIGGRVPVIIHICGKLDQVMKDIAATGVSAISVESAVDIAKVKAEFAADGIRTPIIGAVHPIKVLLEGGIADVDEAVQASAAAGADAISPDCAVAPDTVVENLQELVRAAEKLLSKQA